MDSLHNRLKDELVAARTNLLLQLERASLKHGKYYPAKFANFVYICITREESYHFRGNFSSKMVTFSARNINI